MVNAAMAKMKADNPDIEFMLVPGDMVGHGIDVDIWTDRTLDQAQTQTRYEATLAVQKSVVDLFNIYFGDVPVLPVFGNNDTKYHY